MNLDHFALSHICDNCPVKVNSVGYTYINYVGTMYCRDTLFVPYNIL